MDTETLTALTTQYTDGIGSLKTPALAIMGAGITITILVAAFHFMNKRTRESTRA